MQRAAEGVPKLHLIRTALRVRAERPPVFGERSWYQPLLADGARAGHVVAYARGEHGASAGVVTVAVRLAHSVHGDWADTSLEIPGGTWRNALTGDGITGGRVGLGELLHEFPVALLVLAP